MCLLLVLTGVWVTKVKTPAERPDSYKNGYVEEAAWWNITIDSDVDEKWVLDPEIPSNYLPVPGENELYMVVNSDGTIEKYRKRTKQDDGSWVWEDTNPDIPDNYETVAGLENIYRVTDKDGKVSYFRYVRNADDTFAFIEVDENGNDLVETPTDQTIPENYAHLSGNVYAVMNEHGVLTGYKERSLNADGTYSWKDVEKPSENNGGEIITAYDASLDIPSVQMPGLSLPQGGGGGITYTPGQGMTQGGGDTTVIIITPDNMGYVPNYEPDVVYSDDGTYTETEVLTETDTSGGYITTYQTTVERVYDAQGNLMSTKRGDRQEIDRKPISENVAPAPSTNEIKGTLAEEVARITVGVSFDTNLASQVLTALNASRAADGLPALSMDSGTAMQLAKARAAAAAIYGSADNSSPLYGTASEMCATFGISASPSENIWRTSLDKTAEQINARFMSIDGAKSACLNSAYTTVGIAIAQRNGYLYVIEIFM